jgi:phosphatidylglycerol:prolipoprotein diacylglycerol transferase
MLPVLQIGPLALPTARLLWLLGIFLGISLMERFARRRGENADLLANLILLGGVIGMVSARLAYAAVHFGLFVDNPAALVSLDPGLLDPWAGLAGGALAALVYGQRKGMRFWATLDALTPLLALLAVFVALAHAASGAAFGAATDLPWGIELWGAVRHPSQLYAALGAGAILFLLWKRFALPGSGGRTFLAFAALTCGLAVFLAAFRGDSRLVLGGIRQEQVLALAGLGLSLLLLEARNARR